MMGAVALAACSSGGDSTPSKAPPATVNGGGSGELATAGTGGAVTGSSEPPPQAGNSGAGGADGTAGGGVGGGIGMPTAGAASDAGAAGAAAGGLDVTVEPAAGLWTGVRHYAGATPSGRTNGPPTPPEKTFKLHNAGSSAVALTLSLTGANATKFKLLAPATPQLDIAPGADAEVRLSVVTDDAMLSPAPAQNDGSTVLEASLEVTGAARKVSVRNYALVLTYVELEPTFGQIFRAFPEWTTKLPSWLPDNANPNPGALPGVVAGTDEVAAPAFERLDEKKPAKLRPLARFSPSGLVPFGWYEPGKVADRTTAGTLAMQPDPQTNDKARMLEPPLASGTTSIEPSVAKFGIWMAPAGVGLLTSKDADGFDGQHRVRAFTLRDAGGSVVPGSFLVCGEEAKNGDYQDYVFVLENVKPAP